MPPRAQQRNFGGREKMQLMSSSEIERTLVRLAHEIIEKNNGAKDLALVGIRQRGVPLAHRLAGIIRRIEKKSTVPVGTLDITLHRDDLATRNPRPQEQKSEINFDLNGKDVVLVDDVLYTGRTARAGMDALFTHGRPRKVQLCVFVDRGHRELPIEATYVGRRVETLPQESILVQLREVDDVEKVLLLEKN
jgi:pyrimidine operon attenuation protein/uracil phosphoribosyltransferase